MPTFTYAPEARGSYNHTAPAVLNPFQSQHSSKCEAHIDLKLLKKWGSNKCLLLYLLPIHGGWITVSLSKVIDEKGDALRKTNVRYSMALLIGYNEINAHLEEITGYDEEKAETSLKSWKQRKEPNANII